MKLKIKSIIILFTSIVAFTACTEEKLSIPGNLSGSETVFRLNADGYQEEGIETRSSTGYDKLYYHFADEEGNILYNIKSYYDRNTSEIKAEGLHSGNYYLIVLGITGDDAGDGAEVLGIDTIDDVWLQFPENLRKPLEAEYFHSVTPFTVSTVMTSGGKLQEVADVPGTITQKRIIAAVDFSFDYANKSVGNSVVSRTLNVDGTRFCTSVSGKGAFGGSSSGDPFTVALDMPGLLKFPVLADGSAFMGTVDIKTVNYLRESIAQSYGFKVAEIMPNSIHSISTKVKHPDDRLGTVYVTGSSMQEGEFSKILQDDEPKETYTDRKMRSFNTAEPLQVNLDDDGKLHVRFYSPKSLENVLISARIPSVSEKYFDLAYFTEIPAFADYHEHIPLFEKSMMVRTEDGNFLELPELDTESVSGIEFRIDSESEYWKKLERIEHGWNIYWGLFGGNPDTEDGSPVGNWMGIRPVHCRESVALFLNFTYMIDMPEHEQILRDNADALYDDNGQPVKVEEVLEKMRAERTLQVGLVYPGNGVIGLGSPSVFGSYQRGWFEHYFNTYACSVMFHELGHVMGYGHSSSFTYGPWAEKLMNNFYVDNISVMPVDSKSYLDSANNPFKYSE